MFKRYRRIKTSINTPQRVKEERSHEKGFLSRSVSIDSLQHFLYLDAQCPGFCGLRSCDRRHRAHGGTIDLDGLERTVAFIRSAAAPFRGQSEPPTPVALRFPLGAAGAGGAVLWLDVARRIAEWSQMVPTCFWSVSSRRSDLVVQLGHTPPSTFGELWAPRVGSEHLCDLTEPLTLAPVNLADPTDDQHRAGRRGAGPGGGADGGAQHGGAQHGGAQHGGVDAPRQVALAGQTSIFEFLCSL